MSLNLIPPTPDHTKHMWGPVKDEATGATRSYAPCGVVVGSFVHDPDKVECTECLAKLKENDSANDN